MARSAFVLVTLRAVTRFVVLSNRLFFSILQRGEVTASSRTGIGSTQGQAGAALIATAPGQIHRTTGTGLGG